MLPSNSFKSGKNHKFKYGAVTWIVVILNYFWLFGYSECLVKVL